MTVQFRKGKGGGPESGWLWRVRVAVALLLFFLLTGWWVYLWIS